MDIDAFWEYSDPTASEERFRAALTAPNNELTADERLEMMNQAHYVKGAGVSLVLYFERLPDCLHALPFVDAQNLPPFPHREERGPQVSGTFFDHFQRPEDEAAVWAYAAEDFTTFGYERYNPALPAAAGDCLWTEFAGAR